MKSLNDYKEKVNKQSYIRLAQYETVLGILTRFNNQVE